MTIEHENYLTRALMNRDQKVRGRSGWHSLHIHFINNDESQGYRVTYVNGTDDPHNIPPIPPRTVTTRQLLEEIALERNLNLL